MTCYLYLYDMLSLYHSPTFVHCINMYIPLAFMLPSLLTNESKGSKGARDDGFWRKEWSVMDWWAMRWMTRHLLCCMVQRMGTLYWSSLQAKKQWTLLLSVIGNDVNMAFIKDSTFSHESFEVCTKLEYESIAREKSFEKRTAWMGWVFLIKKNRSAFKS